MTAVFLLISAAINLSSCALQTEMSPEIFLERLAEADKTLSVDFDGRYYSGDRCYCFVSDGEGPNMCSPCRPAPTAACSP